MSNYLEKRLINNRNQRKQQRSERQKAAQKANAGMNLAPGNFAGYDAKAHGTAAFDKKDAKYIKSQGGTRQDVYAAKKAFYESGGKKRQTFIDERKRIKGLGTMDAETQSISEYDAGKKFGVQDFRYLEKQGYSKEQIAEEFARRGSKLNQTRGNYFLKAGQLDTVAGNKRTKALRKAKAFQDGGGSSGNGNGGGSGGNKNNNGNPNISDSGNVSGSGNDNSINDSFNDNKDQSMNTGDISQNVGNQNTYDFNNSGTINAGAGSNIGNFDYSVTIGQNGVQGNNNSQGGGGSNNKANGAWEGPLANLQYTAAYKALGQNDYARSQSQMSGVGRAGQALAQYDSLGYGNIPINAYNMVGMMAQASRDRADMQSAYYMGDYFGTNPGPGVDWSGLGSPVRPKDKTEEIAGGFNT